MSARQQFIPSWKRLWVFGWLLGLLALLTGGLMTGCTSDIPSEVGLSQVSAEIDVVLEPLGLEDVQQYTAKNVRDDDVPLLDQELLYLGDQSGNSSSILMNFDFSDVYSDSVPESAWTLENISKVEMRLIMAKYYGLLFEPEEEDENKANPDKVIAKYYELYELVEPFAAENFPGMVPDDQGINLNINPVLDESKEVKIEINAGFLLNWIEQGGTRGFNLREGAGSLPGISGFASKELSHPGEFEDINFDPGVTPSFKVQFVQPDTAIFLETFADISSFHSVSQAPAAIEDGMMVRTCLRSYPMLRFDFSSLPENAFVNRAVLAVTSDTTSFGNLQAIVVSEIPVEFFGVPGDTMPLADLENVVYSISGMVNLDTQLNFEMEFNVTTAVQRIVNNVYEGDRAFILTAGEDFFPGFDLDSVDPDFYLTQFNFFGLSAEQELRPQLKLSYSLLNDIGGG